MNYETGLAVVWSKNQIGRAEAAKQPKTPEEKKLQKQLRKSLNQLDRSANQVPRVDPQVKVLLSKLVDRARLGSTQLKLLRNLRIGEESIFFKRLVWKSKIL